MPALEKNQAIKKLAEVVEKSKPTVLAEIYAELFPEKPADAHPSASDLAQHIRDRIAVEEIVDLWNVLIPEDRNVWYDEQENQIHYNEEFLGYADAD